MARILVERLVVESDSIAMTGHVNNQEYVRWMQNIATAHSGEQGWTLSRYLATQTPWVIRSHYIEYIRPAHKGDELKVATWTAGMGERNSPRRYRFVGARDGKTVVEAETLSVYCDARTGRSIDIPEAVRAAFPIISDTHEIKAAIASG